MTNFFQRLIRAQVHAGGILLPLPRSIYESRVPVWPPGYPSGTRPGADPGPGDTGAGAPPREVSFGEDPTLPPGPAAPGQPGGPEPPRLRGTMLSRQGRVSVVTARRHRGSPPAAPQVARDPEPPARQRAVLPVALYRPETMTEEPALPEPPEAAHDRPGAEMAGTLPQRDRTIPADTPDPSPGTSRETSGRDPVPVSPEPPRGKRAVPSGGQGPPGASGSPALAGTPEIPAGSILPGIPPGAREAEQPVSPVSRAGNAGNTGARARADVPGITYPEHIPVPAGSRAPLRPEGSRRPVFPGPEPPVIRVSIGRIDVRAAMPSPPIPGKAAGPPVPRLSLQEYLRSRSGEER